MKITEAMAFAARAVAQCLIGPPLLWVDRRVERKFLRRITASHRALHFGSLMALGSDAFLDRIKAAMDLLMEVDPRRARRVLKHLTVVACVPEVPVAPGMAVYWPSSGVVYVDDRQIADAADLASVLVAQATHAYVVRARRVQFGEVSRSRHSVLMAVEMERFRKRLTAINVRRLKP